MSDVYSLWGQGHPPMTHYFYLMLEEFCDPYAPSHNGPDHENETKGSFPGGSLALI